MKIQATIGAVALAIGAGVIGFKLQAAEPAATQAASGQQPLAITVYKSPSCGCCTGWVEHLEENGFAVMVEDTNTINEVKMEHQVPRNLASCHTALIGGAVIEGHVTAGDIRAYLASNERPFGERTLGIAVPGMPHGVPGMETGRQDSYDVIAFAAGDRTATFRSHQF